MEDCIIVLIVLVLVGMGIYSSRKHFKGEGGCCGGGSTVGKRKRKKLKTVIAKKTFFIEGMTCNHCKERVERSVEVIDGVACKVNLKKGMAMVSMEKEISDTRIRDAIEHAGYHVTAVE